MLEPSLSQLMQNIDTRYLLVNVTADRAHAILNEAEERGEVLTGKPVKMAIEEIARGYLTAHTRRDNHR